MTALVPTFQVVARMRPLLEKTERYCFPAYVTISDVLRDLGVLRASKFLRYTVQDTGTPIHSNEWDAHRPGPGALLAVRAVATGGGGDAGKDIARLVGALAAIATGAWVGGIAALGTVGAKVAGAAVSAGILWGTNQLIGTPDQEQGAFVPDPEINTRNKVRPDGTEMRIHGRMRVYPDLAARPYLHSYGDTRDVYLLYSFGPGPLDLSDVKIDDTNIGDIEGIDTSDPGSYDVVTGDGVDVRTVAPPVLRKSEFTPGDYEIPESTSPPFTLSTDEHTHEAILKFSCPDGLGALVDEDATYTGDEGIETPHPDRGRWVLLETNIKVEARHIGGAGWTEVYPAGYSDGERIKEKGHDGAYKTFAYRYNLMEDFSQTTAEQYQFRFTRYGDAVTTRYPPVDSDDYTKHSTIYVVGIDNIEWTDPINEGQMGGNVHIASIGLRIPYEKAQAIKWDKLNCIARSKLLRWSGSAWGVAYTSYPEAMFRDALQGDSLNWGSQLANARLDLDSLQDWADFCRTGGYAFNAVWDRQRTVRQVLTAICAVGRATPIMVDGKYGVHWDRQVDTPVQHLSPRNTWGGSAVRRLPKPLHAVRAPFIYKGTDDSYLPTERIIYKDGYGAANASNIQKMRCFGITDEDQIDLLAWYHINCAYLRLETRTYQMDMENLVCTRGNPVTISDDVPMIGNKRGRIKSVTLDGTDVTHVTLDEPVEIDSANYLLRVRCHNAPSAPYRYSMRTPKLVNAGDWVTTVEFVTAIPAPSGTTGQPAAEDLFFFGEEATPDVLIERWYFVSAIEPHEDLTATVTLIEEASGREDAASTGVYDAGTEASYQPDTQNEPWPDKLDPQTPSIVAVTTDEGVLYWGPDGTLHSQIVLTLEYESGYFAPVHQVEVQYRLHPDEYGDHRPWTAGITYAGPTPRVSIRDVEDRFHYDARVRTRSAEDRVSPWAVEEDIEVIGKTTPPPDPENLTLEDDRLLRWAYGAPPLDLRGFEVRRHSGDDPGWDRAKPITPHPIDACEWPISPWLVGTFTFYVKALDRASPPNYSEAASLTLEMGDPSDVPNLESSPAKDWQDDGWPGTVENGTILSGEIRQQDISEPMIYTSGWWFSTAESGYEDAPVIGVTNVVAEGDSWWIEYQTFEAGAFDRWHSWPGRFSLRARDIGGQQRVAVRYRVTVGPSSSQGKITALDLTRGYPNIDEVIIQNHLIYSTSYLLECTRGQTHMNSVNGTIIEPGAGPPVHAIVEHHAWAAGSGCYKAGVTILKADGTGTCRGLVRYLFQGYRSYLGPD